MHWNTEGEEEKKTQKEKGRDDDKGGIYLEWSSCDKIAMVRILLTSILYSL